MMRRDHAASTGRARSARVAALAAGILHATSFATQPLPAWALPFVQILAMATLVRLVWRSASARHAAALGFAFGLGNFATGLYWMHTSMHVYGGVAWWAAALAVLLLAAFLALYPACASTLAWRLTTCQSASLVFQDEVKRGSPHQEPQAPPNRGGEAPTEWSEFFTPRVRVARFGGLHAALAWASSWVLFEWLRGTLFTGFPWLNVAYAHVDSVFSAWASVTGAYGVAWCAALAAAALALLAHPRWRDRARNNPVFPALLFITCLSAAGVWLGSIAWTTPHGAPILVRLIQGNITPQEKFTPGMLPQHLDLYHRLAALPTKNGGAPPALIVLPETAIPVLQHHVPPAAWQRWIELARTQQATILIGTPVRSARAGHWVDTNSVVAIDSASTVAALIDGTALRYDKAHLVPFGEFIPTGFRWLVETMAIPLGDFGRGAARQPLLSVAGQTIAPNICYEDVFGEGILPAVRASTAHGDAGASLLVNVSDLAWFGDAWALAQHRQMARMRSLETARPMLRATNTGMTAAISPKGMIYAQLPAHTIGVLDVQVQGRTGLTPYVRLGNTPILLWIAASLGLLAGIRTHTHRLRTSALTDLHDT